MVTAGLYAPLRSFSYRWQTYSALDPADPTNNIEQNIAFQFQAAEIALHGHFLTKNLTYTFLADLTAANFIPDVELTYHLPWVRGLSVTFGRFRPMFSLMMPRMITRLGTTQYPMFLTEGGYAPWRDLGVQIKYALTIGKVGVLNAYLGVFNGEPNQWTDTNDMKDFLARVDFQGKGSLKGISAGFWGWFGFPSCVAGTPSGDTCVPAEQVEKKVDTDMRFGLFAEFQRTFGMITPHVMVEGFMRKFTPRASDGADYLDTTGGGFWAHAGLRIGKYIEPMARIEWMTTSHVGRHAGNPEPDPEWSDAATRLTVGLNIYLHKIHSHLKINYIFHYMSRGYSGMPQWIEVDNGDQTAVPLPPPMVNQAVHMLIIQAATEF